MHIITSARLLLSQGKRGEASARFIRALEIAPDLVDLFANLTSTLYRLNPALEEAVRRATQAWPALLSERELLGRPALPGLPTMRCCDGCSNPSRFATSSSSAFSLRYAASCSTAPRRHSQPMALMTKHCCFAAHWRASVSSTSTCSRSGRRSGPRPHPSRMQSLRLWLAGTRRRHCGLRQSRAIFRCMRRSVRANFWTEPGRRLSRRC